MVFGKDQKWQDSSSKQRNASVDYFFSEENPPSAIAGWKNSAHVSLSPPSFLRAGRFPLSQPENHINANICETNIRDKVYYCLFGFGQEREEPLLEC